MTNHTPTPWEVVDDTFIGSDVDNHGFICRVNTDHVDATVNDAANAAHIVKAVNHHDELVELARQCVLAHEEGDPMCEDIAAAARAILAEVQS